MGTRCEHAGHTCLTSNLYLYICAGTCAVYELYGADIILVENVSAMRFSHYLFAFVVGPYIPSHCTLNTKYTESFRCL